ncbi:penicillin-binding transpeptidase domain-containing protein [Proteinivorax hydrogeniformans]|uniref:beta-lactamase n=1 Tax=Proteinivorax hydrogeniformans TaxID=1826727 RepID=A0AAU8HQY5_9FIRM
MYKRINVLLIVFLLIFAFLLAKVGYLSLFKHTQYSQQIVNQRMKTLIYNCNRGDILDRNLDSLLKTEETQGWASYCPENKKVIFSQEKADEAKPVTITKRKTDIANHLLGLINHHNLYSIFGYKGVSGIEAQYNDDLAAAPSKVSAFTDVYGELLSPEHFHDIKNPENETVVVLTIDSSLQQQVEYIVDKNDNMQQGAVIIMDPSTGEVLTMLSRPTHNYEQADDGSHINKAITIHKQYNPASLFKIVTSITAIENGYKLQDTFLCGGDSCPVVHGRVTLQEAFAYSCNEVFHEITTDIGPSEILKTASKLGLGKSTEVGLDFESKGKIPQIDTVSGIKGNRLLAMGQGQLEVTPIQIAKLTSIVANGGYNIHPNIVHYIGEKPTLPSSSIDFFNAKPIISLDTSNKLKKMMQSTISYGTAKDILYGGGAKTGTADNGLRWIAGFFPYENPKYVITILVENGQSPVKIMQEILSEIGL